MNSSAHTKPATDTARLRSGTAARLAGVPVATLRVWERRYGVVAAPKTPTGQRLYSGHDVQRLRLIRQLTERGQAIGTIATLPLDQLQQRAAPEAAAPPAGSAGRRVLVGATIAARLKALPGWDHAVLHADLDAAEAADPLPADLLVVHLPSLQPAAARRLLTLAERLHARSVVLVYGFGTDAVVQQLRACGVRVRRDPVGTAELARLVAAPPKVQAAAMPPIAAGPLPRHFSDQALAALAAAATSVACECPRHLVEIVQQLAGFERYSTECGSRSPADAALHAQLGVVTGTARAMFEQALLQVMAAEGIVMPA